LIEKESRVVKTVNCDRDSLKEFEIFFEKGTEPLCYRLKRKRFCDLGLSELETERWTNIHRDATKHRHWLTSSDSKMWQQMVTRLRLRSVSDNTAAPLLTELVDGLATGLTASRTMITSRSPMSAMYEIVWRAWSIITSCTTIG